METLEFGINITWIHVHISLLDDRYLESEEFFRGVLTTSDPAVILDPDEVTVVIEDDDSTLSMYFFQKKHSALLSISHNK